MPDKKLLVTLVSAAILTSLIVGVVRAFAPPTVSKFLAS